MAQRPSGFEIVSYSAALPAETKDSWVVFTVRRRGRGDSQSCHAHTILKAIGYEAVAREQRARV
jgi:hypothetical protein